MPDSSVEKSAIIAARPEVLYAIIADYRRGHPNILPKQYFTRLDVEEGGTGAGTIITFSMKVLGVARDFRMAISEPEPGRVLIEKSLTEDLFSTFTVTPRDGGNAAEVTIRTDWAARPGLAGWLEKKITQAMSKRIYARELEQLASFAQQPQARALAGA